MGIKEIIEQWLIKNGYEGLYRDDCGCEVGDLMPCNEPSINCTAGHKVPCPGPENCQADGDCPWHISGNKPVESEAEDV